MRLADEQRSAERARVRDVYFVLLPQVVLLDVAGPAEAFRLASLQAKDSYRLHFTAPTRRLGTSIGLALADLSPLPRSVGNDAIVVLNGMSGAAVDWSDPAVTQVVDWLASGVTSRGLLACVCSGGVLAGKAGLLDGRECTTHHAHIEELRAIAPAARVMENRIFVQDGAVFTSAGVTAGVDLTLHLVSQQLGPMVAAEVARDLVVYLRRSGGDAALSPWVRHRNHLHPAVHRVQDAVARRPAAQWSAEALSAVACTSPRNLARLFAEHAHCSPLDYVQLIRCAFARELIGESALDLEGIAARAGFNSAQHLRRVWSRWEKQPPSAFRAARSSPARSL